MEGQYSRGRLRCGAVKTLDTPFPFPCAVGLLTRVQLHRKGEWSETWNAWSGEEDEEGGRLELTASMELRKENCNLYEEGPDQKLERSSEKLYAFRGATESLFPYFPGQDNFCP